MTVPSSHTALLEEPPAETPEELTALVADELPAETPLELAAVVADELPAETPLELPAGCGSAPLPPSLSHATKPTPHTSATAAKTRTFIFINTPEVYLKYNNSRSKLRFLNHAFMRFRALPIAAVFLLK